MCVSSLEKCLFGVLPVLKSGCWWSFCFCVVDILCIFWMLSHYRIYGLQTSSLTLQVAFSVSWLFPLLCRNFLAWCSPSCLFLLFLFMLLVPPWKKSSPRSVSCSLPHVLFQELYGFRYYVYVLNKFCADFCVWCKIKTQFHFSMKNIRYTIFLILFVKETVLSPLCILGAFVENCWLYICGFISRLSICSVGQCVCFCANTNTI